MASCKSCKKALYTLSERDTAYCDQCRHSNEKCLKCGNYLVSAERETGVCMHCRKFDTKCKLCGVHLINKKELDNGICDRCRIK